MSLGDKLRKSGLKLGSKALQSLMNDPKKAAALGRALQAYQAGRESLDKTSERIRHFANLVSRDDLDQLSNRISTLKRRAKRLATKADKLT